MHDQRPINLMEEMDNARREFKNDPKNDEVQIKKLYLLPIIGVIFILSSIVMLIMTIINKERFSFNVITTFFTGYILLSIHLRISDLETKFDHQALEIERISKVLREFHKENDKKKGN